MNVAAQWYISGGSGVEVAASIEAGIREGRLPPASRLPTVRELAGSLGLSPTTVAGVYRDLGHRGLLTAAGRLGTTVSARPPVALSWRQVFAPGIHDLASGNPDPALFPKLARHLRRLEVPTTNYGDPANDAELVELARRRFSADGVPAHHLTVVGGALDGVERVLQAHLRPGDRVAVEDPGYPGILDLVAALGLVARPVAVDDCGPRPDALAAALGAGAAALVLTPRAQNPYGAALDPERAADLGALLDSHPTVLVVEDDHAGEIAGVGACTLCAAERPRWAVIRSVAKSLGPDLRLAVLTGDAVTVARIEGRRLLGTGWVSHILQRLVVDLWNDPATPRLLQDAARTYAERRSALVSALAGHGIAAHGRSGINVWIPVTHEAGAVAALLDRGWGVLAGERFRIRAGRAIRVSTARLSPEDARHFAADLAAALEIAPARLA
ncbi:MAG TPA: aminotransferase class I/II-fold pyridoxal phosphate-dependent enzyme [Candidatus Dormibacteraeota bacterium]